MAGRQFPARVMTFLHDCARWRGMTFPATAALAAELFGTFAPTVDEIATFVCQLQRGKASLCRFRRDIDMVAFVLACPGSARQVHAACLGKFGPARTPALRSLKNFLCAATRGSARHDPSLEAQDPAQAAWLAGVAPHMTLTELAAAATDRYGPERAANRSRIHRYLLRAGISSAGRATRIAKGTPLAAFFEARAGHMTLRQMRAAAVQVFGAAQVPSLSIIHRFVVWSPAWAKRPPAWAMDDPEVAAFLLGRRGKATLDAARDESIARFGLELTPSRSAIHRLWHRGERN